MIVTAYRFATPGLRRRVDRGEGDGFETRKAHKLGGFQVTAVADHQGVTLAVPLTGVGVDVGVDLRLQPSSASGRGHTYQRIGVQLNKEDLTILQQLLEAGRVAPVTDGTS